MNITANSSFSAADQVDADVSADTSAFVDVGHSDAMLEDEELKLRQDDVSIDDLDLDIPESDLNLDEGCNIDLNTAALCDELPVSITEPHESGLVSSSELEWSREESKSLRRSLIAYF